MKQDNDNLIRKQVSEWVSDITGSEVCAEKLQN
jgi:hypothetical protein